MSNVPSSQTGDRLDADALVIGSGIAGLLFALELSDRSPDRSILLVSKTALGEGNSRRAQGGIAVVSAAGDSLESHLADTLAAGAGLCREHAVRSILERAPAAFERLRAHGIEFDAARDGSPELSLEGGHSRRRIHHRGDRTGRSIIEALVAATRARPRLRILEGATAVDLIAGAPGLRAGEGGEVLGASLLDERTGRIHVATAAVTVLATGGSGKVFRYTTNAESATGDGVAMAYRAGARVANLEFFQFHPTLLWHPRVNDLLLTEALRGEGALLRLPESGERFLLEVDPVRAELATRDVVARAIYLAMERHGLEHVHLDLRAIDRAVLVRKFPGLLDALAALDIDPGREPVPVVPAAHYQCGGVVAGVDGATDLTRLLAIGEVACTGLHGANRLASNSLMEAIVMACAAARAAERWLAEPAGEREIRDWDSTSVTNPRRASQINAHWRGLRGEMWSYAGIVRTEAGLADLLRLVRVRREMIEEYYRRHTVTRDLLELRNIALVAELIAEGALQRRESVGGHYREDHPGSLPRSTDTVLGRQRVHPPSPRRERPLA